MSKYDYIIVGGGLAGSVLAMSLIRKNKSVLIIDEPSLSSSSKVAAGLYQPMTFKRTIETWEGLNSIKKSTEFYQWAEMELNETFFHPMKMSRIFSSFEEQNNWALKCDDKKYSELITEENNEDAEICNTPFGYGSVHHAGYLDVNKFLYSVTNFLIQKNWILTKKVNYDLIHWENEKVFYKNYEASQIIFCEGWLVKDNPWFAYLPMKPVKGEVITFEIKEKENTSIISSGIFSVPISKNQYKVGSNYDWKDLTEEITEKNKAEFTSKIKEMFNVNDVSIIQQQAGIRPASNDRRPIIGAHPQYDFLNIFNGLGARGVSLAPYAASFFIENLINKKEIPQEMNVNRFAKYFHR